MRTAPARDNQHWVEEYRAVGKHLRAPAAKAGQRHDRQIAAVTLDIIGQQLARRQGQRHILVRHEPVRRRFGRGIDRGDRDRRGRGRGQPRGVLGRVGHEGRAEEEGRRRDAQIDPRAPLDQQVFIADRIHEADEIAVDVAVIGQKRGDGDHRIAALGHCDAGVIARDGRVARVGRVVDRRHEDRHRRLGAPAIGVSAAWRNDARPV
jgi:hypothetical protein